MSIDHPYHRTCRPTSSGKYSPIEGYIKDKRYADSGSLSVRSFQLLQEDLKVIFEYTEPSDRNLSAYGLKMHELIVRSCIELEANFKAVLLENGYSKTKRLNMSDYLNLEATHRLSEYVVRLPFWNGEGGTRRPFAAWDRTPLVWYQAYNAVKHDRHMQFEQASLENAIDAICGLLCVLSSQFWIEEFSSSPDYIVLSHEVDGWHHAIGKYMQIAFPHWPNDECYEFKWDSIKEETNPFRKLWSDG